MRTVGELSDDARSTFPSEQGTEQTADRFSRQWFGKVGCYREYGLRGGSRGRRAYEDSGKEHILDSARAWTPLPSDKSNATW